MITLSQKVTDFTNADVPMGKRAAQPTRPVAPYVLRMAIANGDLQIYFTPGPQSANLPPTSVPIKVLNDCIISLEIDKALNCTFVQDNGVGAATLSTQAVANNYWNLYCSPDAKSLHFEADYSDIGALDNPDPFNLYVVVAQPPLASGVASRALPIKIDPDIQNPGDPDTLGGH